MITTEQATATPHAAAPSAAATGSAHPSVFDGAADSGSGTGRADPHRVIRIERYEREKTGVWFYQIDIELHYYDSDEGLDVYPEVDVQYYSVRRRYSEFLQLYETIKQEVATEVNSTLPPFPSKEYLSPTVFGMLWRMTTSMYVLEERRTMFETLLQWIEAHPLARTSAGYIEFLGQPPQSSEGYVSLKQYSSQHWLSSLEQMTRDKRRRRLSSSDCSTYSLQTPARATKKRRPLPFEEESSETRLSETKRARRHDIDAKKKATSPVCTSSTRKRTREVECEIAPEETTAQVESSRVSKKAKL